MDTRVCLTCHAPIVRDWIPTDATLANYHAGCRPSAGRLPYRPRDLDAAQNGAYGPIVANAAHRTAQRDAS